MLTSDEGEELSICNQRSLNTSKVFIAKLTLIIYCNKMCDTLIL